MQGVLGKWTPREKYFKYQNFPDSGILFLETLGGIFKFS